MRQIFLRQISVCAALILALTPTLAQSNTRAGDSGATYERSAAALSGSEKQSQLAGQITAADFFVALLLSSWVTGIVFVATKNENQSPGAN
ncbi:MAG: hypothetical protein AAGK17_08510 [Pseudomonadota bacterium]